MEKKFLRNEEKKQEEMKIKKKFLEDVIRKEKRIKKSNGELRFGYG